MNRDGDELKQPGWPISTFTEEDLDIIDQIVARGGLVDRSVVRELVAEVRRLRGQISGGEADQAG